MTLIEDAQRTEASHSFYWELLSDGDPPVSLGEIVGPRPAWEASAACKGMETERFFPPSWDDIAHAEARAICERCGVLQECLGYALADSLCAGIWGGTTGMDRRQLRRASA